MSASKRLVLFAAAVILVIGCSKEETTTVQQAPPSDLIRSTLEYTIETGQLDSGLMEVHNQIEKMKESDPTKAAELSEALGELEKAKGPADVKAKAQAMLSKL